MCHWQVGHLSLTGHLSHTRYSYILVLWLLRQVNILYMSYITNSMHSYPHWFLSKFVCKNYVLVLIFTWLRYWSIINTGIAELRLGNVTVYCFILLCNDNNYNKGIHTATHKHWIVYTHYKKNIAITEVQTDIKKRLSQRLKAQ